MKILSYLFLAFALATPLAANPPKSPAEARSRLPEVYRVESSKSMKGYVAGDSLLVEPARYEDIKVGDHVLVWYKDAPMPYFHIAIRKVPTVTRPRVRWLVQGDNNPGPDVELMSEATYIGRWKRAPLQQ